MKDLRYGAIGVEATCCVMISYHTVQLTLGAYSSATIIGAAACRFDSMIEGRNANEKNTTAHNKA